jgi:hypothetical protein
MALERAVLALLSKDDAAGVSKRHAWGSDARNRHGRRRSEQQGKVGETPDPKWDGGGSVGRDTVQMASLIHPAESKQRRGTSRVQIWNGETLTPPCLGRGREKASVWESGQRRQRPHMPGCNGRDMRKVRQGKTRDDRNTGTTKENRGRRHAVVSCSLAERREPRNRVRCA